MHGLRRYTETARELRSALFRPAWQQSYAVALLVALSVHTSPSAGVVLAADAPGCAGCSSAPMIVLRDVYTTDAMGRETHWPVQPDALTLAAAADGLVTARIAVPKPGQRVMLSGWVRADSLASVRCGGSPAATRSATKQELTELGWPVGWCFTADVTAGAGTVMVRTVVVTDGVGNISRVEVELHTDGPPGPEVLLVEPSPTRGIEVLPRAPGLARRVRVYVLEDGAPGYGGELQLTDAIDALRLSGVPVYAYEIDSCYWDTRNKEGYVNAFVYHALQDRELVDSVRRLLAEAGLLARGT